MARLALGMLFTVAGVSKARDRERFRLDLEQLGFTGRSGRRMMLGLIGRLAARLVPALEAASGALLLLGLETRAAAAAAACLLLGFTAVLATTRRRSRGVVIRC